MTNLRSPQSAVRSPQSAVRSPQSAVRSPQSAVRSPQSAVRSPQSAVRSPQSAVRSPQSAVRSPQSAVRSPQSAVRSPQSAVRSPQSAVRSPQSAVRSPQSAVRSPQKKTAPELNSSRNSSKKLKINGDRNRVTPLIFSFFSGAGFLDLGFEKAGFEIGYVNEVHKPFLDAYKYSRQKMGTPQPLHGYFEGDIECCLTGKEAKHLSSLVNAAKNDKQLVGFIGGPPCPDFSVGGKNRGQHGKNGEFLHINLTHLMQ